MLLLIMYYLRSKLRTLGKLRLCQFCVFVALCVLLLISLRDNLYFQKSSFASLSTGKSGSDVSHRHISRILFKRKGSLSLPDTNKASTSIRILCYILISRAKVKAGLLIKETWGSHCDELVFFGGFEYSELPVVKLNITEGYENLWGKSKAAILYLSTNTKYKNFHYFLKADDDTFVVVENLRKFITDATQDVNKPIWFGFKLKHKRMPQGYMSGGAGYVFNYEALLQVSNLLKQKFKHDYHNLLSGIGDCNIDGEYGIEDLELGKCFLNAGVESVNTTDENGRERFLPLPYDVFLNGVISSFHWIWNQAWNRVRTGESCCSKNLVSMHEVSPHQMKTIYYLLYKIKVNEVK